MSRAHRPRSFAWLHVVCALATWPLWVGPLVADLIRNPPSRWS
jgi:hypothetical protein